MNYSPDDNDPPQFAPPQEPKKKDQWMYHSNNCRGCFC
jgi:hypothetical protein